MLLRGVYGTCIIGEIVKHYTACVYIYIRLIDMCNYMYMCIHNQYDMSLSGNEV